MSFEVISKNGLSSFSQVAKSLHQLTIFILKNGGLYSPLDSTLICKCLAENFGDNTNRIYSNKKLEAILNMVNLDATHKFLQNLLQFR